MMSEIVSPITMFDILNNDKGLDATLLMKFDEEALQGDTILDQMKDVGFESNNSILNLGTMFFVL